MRNLRIVLLLSAFAFASISLTGCSRMQNPNLAYRPLFKMPNIAKKLREKHETRKTLRSFFDSGFNDLSGIDPKAREIERSLGIK